VRLGQTIALRIANERVDASRVIRILPVGHGMTTPRPETATIRDDVEYLIDVAAQLSSAIERQIRLIELSLEIVRDRGETSVSIEFKERLICASTGLNSSLEATVRQLDASIWKVTNVEGRRAS
jgi:hypothetical protein